MSERRLLMQIVNILKIYLYSLHQVTAKVKQVEYQEETNLYTKHVILKQISQNANIKCKYEALTRIPL